MKKSIRKQKQIPITKILKMGKHLLSGRLTVKGKEFIIMTLAHSPTKEALHILEAYNKMLTSLKYFTQFALEECKWWNE